MRTSPATGATSSTMWENRLRSRIPGCGAAERLRSAGQLCIRSWAGRRECSAPNHLPEPGAVSARRIFLRDFLLPAGVEAPAVSARMCGQQLDGYDSVEVLRYHYDRADTPDPLSRIQYVDMKTYLVDDILVKVDRASMANSLEVRCPLLDHKLMELIAQMPSGLKLHNGHGKVHLQESAGAGACPPRF